MRAKVEPRQCGARSSYGTTHCTRPVWHEGEHEAKLGLGIWIQWRPFKFRDATKEPSPMYDDHVS